MTDLEAQRTLVQIVVDWLAQALGTDAFVERYWNTRRDLLRTNPSAFDGPVGEVLSHVDVTLHSYWSEPQAAGEIGETELRRELEALAEQLRAMDFPMPA